MKPLAPLLGEPSQPLDDFVQASAEALLSQLWRDGAILFRGFAVRDASVFERAMRCLCPELMTDNGEHTPLPGSTRIYRPVDYDPSRQLLWHNENSFDATWPHLIAFCCKQPARSGGETTLASSEALMSVLDPHLVGEFRERGIRYVRRMGIGVGRTWQEVFRTNDRASVEAACRAQRCTFNWLDGNMLQTTCDRPALVRHGITGAECWFSQVQHWHQSCLDSGTRAALLDALGAERMPRDCTFADGGLIPDDAVTSILNSYRQVEVAVCWHPLDVLVVDNLAVAHGRNSFTGKRELWVAMGRLTEPL